MHYPQVVIFERDGLLAALLRPLAEQHKWFVREPRREDACLRLLRRGLPAVLVIRLQADVVPGLALLERATWLCPETLAIVVGEVDNPELAALAWHLGARYVLMPPEPRGRLPAVIESLMHAATERLHAVHSPQEEDLPEASLEDE